MVVMMCERCAKDASVWVFVSFFFKRSVEREHENGQQKSPEPIETTCSELMELIARFELATSSLPRMRSTD